MYIFYNVGALIFLDFWVGTNTFKCPCFVFFCVSRILLTINELRCCFCGLVDCFVYNIYEKAHNDLN